MVNATGFDQGGNPITQVTAGQLFNIEFNTTFNGAPDTTYNTQLNVYGYGNITITNGVGQVDNVSLTAAGTQQVSYYDYGSGLSGSLSLTVAPAAADYFDISAVNANGAAVTTVVAENPVTYDVTAYDTYGNLASEYNGTVNLSTGDGQPLLNSTGQPISTLTLSAGAGTFSATLNVPGSTTINTVDSSNSAVSGSTPITIKSAISGTGVSIQALAGEPFSGLVATFIDANPSAQAGNFTASIDWGVGTISAGSVSAASGGGFDVMGTNTYSQAGSFATAVTVTNNVGDYNDLTGTAVVQVPISMTAPTNNSFTNSSDPVLSRAHWAATPLACNFSLAATAALRGTMSGSAETTAPFSVAIGSALPDGTYEAQAVATESTGFVEISAPVTFTIDTVAPVVTLTSPLDGSATNNSQPTFIGTASTAPVDSSTIIVDIYDGSNTGGGLADTLTTTASGGSFSVQESGLADGTYTAQALQPDFAGNLGYSAAVTFIIDTVPPTISITSPASGATTTNLPTLSADAADNPSGSGLASVQFQYSPDGGVTWIDAGPPETARPFSYTFTTTLPNGNYLVQAIATDNAGNSATSAASSFTINFQPTGLSITSPANGSATNDTQPFITGTAGDATIDSSTITVTLYTGSGVTNVADRNLDNDSQRRLLFRTDKCDPC